MIWISKYWEIRKLRLIAMQSLYMTKRQNKVSWFPGTGKGLVYYKGDTVYSSINLTAYDEIEIGNSKFLFIPFTGKKFNWEETE